MYKVLNFKLSQLFAVENNLIKKHPRCLHLEEGKRGNEKVHLG